mmetsp:Transcript_37241/g.48150  ORF Transcript_37241/g.48150 Transcript_37241/m.48150 type:complete len:241 (+) Transcript_37241:177-899(+)
MPKRNGLNLNDSSLKKKQLLEAAEEPTQTEEEITTQSTLELLDDMVDDSDSDTEENLEETGAAAVEEKTRSCEAGIIDRIYCENFMNHKKLDLQFCRNINFIHGQNGSGKSAILAALQICLGARASTTHRGENLAVLIKRNKEGGHTYKAKVQVTLLNGGPDAFEPLKYGGKVTVEVFTLTHHLHEIHFFVFVFLFTFKILIYLYSSLLIYFYSIQFPLVYFSKQQQQHRKKKKRKSTKE